MRASRVYAPDLDDALGNFELPTRVRMRRHLCRLIHPLEDLRTCTALCPTRAARMRLLPPMARVSSLAEILACDVQPPSGLGAACAVHIAAPVSRGKAASPPAARVSSMLARARRVSWR